MKVITARVTGAGSGVQRLTMLIKRAADIRSSEITDKKLYLNRREFIRRDGCDRGRGGGWRRSAPRRCCRRPTPAPHGRKLENVKKSPLSVDEKPNTWEDITTYNNYYEFGTDKDSPSMLARKLQDRAVDGGGRGRVREEGDMARSRTSSRGRRSRSASTAIAASKRGRW